MRISRINTIDGVGVSEKQGNVGGLILENIRKSDLKDKDLLIVKPDVEEFKAIECIHDVSALVGRPVDVLILALLAQSSVAIIEQLCARLCSLYRRRWNRRWC